MTLGTDTAALLHRSVDALLHLTTPTTHALLSAEERAFSLRQLMVATEAGAKLADAVYVDAVTRQHELVGTGVDTLTGEEVGEEVGGEAEGTGAQTLAAEVGAVARTGEVGAGAGVGGLEGVGGEAGGSVAEMERRRVEVDWDAVWGAIDVTEAGRRRRGTGLKLSRPSRS
ncbi:uncharacterized protein H6S33_007142 [Morchella sextelata]|uniref:uncharacterized protein n=1 Tax=Morchella sextelata TaxID=1174677 RepID=UPI001D05B828|nr:uncharacterized protein H6S33_007142 [Morchella sextelata]KAH0604111.1 hypothetical protein H6S33_007142 [Morchella sextelata]